MEKKYRVIEDSDTNEIIIEECEKTPEGYKCVSVIHPKDTEFFEKINLMTKVEAEELQKEMQDEALFDTSKFTTADMDLYLYNYVLNHNITGFFCVRELGNIWSHSCFAEAKHFEYGDLNYVVGEVAGYLKKGLKGLYYPYRTEKGDGHAHSFEEVLEDCALAEEFELRESEKYYSPMEVETINFMKELSGNSTSYSTSLNYCKADVDVMLNYMRGENNGREGTDC